MRFVFFVPLVVSITALCQPASAQPAPTPAPSEPPAPAPTSRALDEAKDAFRRGTELLQAGDPARALELYLRSRALVPSIPNTLNAAICLDRIGRSDEALEMYEELLGAFGRDLDDATRAPVVAAMTRLRRGLGAIDVSANVEGALVIDGRMRGKLPLAAPLRVKPGVHVVRVMKDGYGAFETRANVTAGGTALVDARLEQLAAAGVLRIDSPVPPGAQVFVDGALLGVAPWEGTLAPGPHVVMLRDGEQGAGPLVARVVQGQTVSFGVPLAPLGPEVQIVTLPASAAIVIDDAPMGAGAWRGRMTRATHRVSAREPGYFDASFVGEPTDMNLVLRPDPSHPRWAKPGRFWVEAFGGYGLSGSLGSGAEAACGSGACSGRSLVAGPLVGARAGYTFRFGGGLELGAGYLRLSTAASRAFADSFVAEPRLPAEQPATVAVAWALDQTVRMDGPWVALGTHYEAPLGSTAFLRARLDGALWFARVRDAVGGTATAGGTTKSAEVDGSGRAVTSNVFMLLPEVDVGMRAGAFSLAAGVALGLTLGSGPATALGDARVGDAHCVSNPAEAGYNRLAIDCAPNRNLLSGERSHGPIVLFVPTISIRYAL